MIPAFVINLLRDVERRMRMQAQLELLPAFDPVFVTAVDGSALPYQVCAALSDTFWSKNRGTIGCFLSHVRAWELLAGLGVPFGVILEDDVDISGLDALSSLALPDDFEIVFVHDRMALDVDERSVGSMEEAFRAHDVCGFGVGAYGYVLTPGAARKLLAACEKDLYFGHVDGRLARYATSLETLEALGDIKVAYVLRNHHQVFRLPQLGLLKGYVSARPLVRLQRGFVSSRDLIDAQA
jgi:GR25 family glycosyltransferase involved in LPS biosynthesis